MTDLDEHRAAIAAALIRAARTRRGGPVRYGDVVRELRAREAFAATKPLLVELLLEDFSVDPRVPVTAMEVGAFGPPQTVYLLNVGHRPRPQRRSRARAPGAVSSSPASHPSATRGRAPLEVRSP